jgi:peptidoglycan/LPS O-acetylase OafA/YrhL
VSELLVRREIFAKPRLPVVDVLRVLAANLIVLHHFVAYGPLARALEARLPQLVTWLFEYGRMAVYVFLVVAGFMSARAFVEWSGSPVVPALRLIWRRYLRLVLPLSAALLLAIAAAALARHWSAEDFIPRPPNLAQFLAHVALLQGVLGVESLATGVWYVAIELQLFALMLLLLKVQTGLPRRSLPVFLITLAMLASWIWFSRRPELDNWAVYFFGAYALGILAWWAGCAQFNWQRFAWVLIVAVTTLVLVHDFRWRMLVALLTAVTLARCGLSQWPDQIWAVTFARWLGERCYAVFLVHFSVLLGLNALIDHWPSFAATHPLRLLAAGWLGSIALGWAFHQWVEVPSMRLIQNGLPVLGMRRLWVAIRIGG